MPFQKVLFQDDKVTIQVAEAGANLTLSAVAAVKFGGGSIANAMTFKSTNEIDITGMQLLDAGFAYFEAKYPSVAAYLKMAQTELNILLPKV